MLIKEYIRYYYDNINMNISIYTYKVIKRKVY